MKGYLNFDLELLDYARVDGRETMRSRVLDSPAGSEQDAEATPVEFPAGLRDDLGRLDRRELSGDGPIELGTKLGLLLLPIHARARYRESLAKLAAGEGLRIRMRADMPELASLPWEYACVVPPDLPAGQVGPECFLGLDRRISIVRYEGSIAATPLPRLAHAEIKVAVLLADVADPAYAPLKLKLEELNLRRALDGVARVETKFLWPGTVAQFQAALDKGIQVLHFAGHGDWQKQMGEEPGTIKGKGSLIFATEERAAFPLEVSQLAANLRARGVCLAILGACEGARRDAISPWTGIAPALVREGIPAVVGMQFGVRDGSAIAFGKRFYDQLAEGRSIDTAVAEGRVAVFTRQGAAERDWGAPVLYLRSTDSVLFPQPPGPLRLNLVLLGANLLLLGVWFLLHLYPLVSATLSRWILALGGAGVVAVLSPLLRLVWSLVRPRADTERTPPLDKIMRKRQATWLLGPLLAMSTLLLSVSGSFWLTLEETASEDAAVLSFTPPDGLPFAKGGVLRVTENARVAGGPFLFPIRGQVVTSLQTPPGWELKTPVQPRLWLPVHLKFPSSFYQPQLRLLKLVTGAGLPWPTADERDPGRTFGLEVTVSKDTPSGPAGEAKPFRLPDVRMGLIYLGASEEVLRQWAAREPAQVRATSLEGCIPSEATPPVREEWLLRWRSGDSTSLSTPVLESGDVVRIRVVNRQNDEVCFDQSVAASALVSGGSTTLCLVHEDGRACLD